MNEMNRLIIATGNTHKTDEIRKVLGSFFERIEDLQSYPEIDEIDEIGCTFEENAEGDGQFDAFMNALEKVYIARGIGLPRLVDYSVRIPPGSHTDAREFSQFWFSVRKLNNRVRK